MLSSSREHQPPGHDREDAKESDRATDLAAMARPPAVGGLINDAVHTYPHCSANALANLQNVFARFFGSRSLRP